MNPKLVPRPLAPDIQATKDGALVQYLSCEPTIIFH